jgi:2',3'-cyclic-nucleotide 2'-phosphodiesterase (5'-nucleotidase family)
MKQTLRNASALILFATFWVSCDPHYRPQSMQYGGYNISKIIPDSTVSGFLEPYARKVGETMNDVIAELGTPLQKQLPDGTLGNFLADSYLAMARVKFDSSAQMAFLNNGGIRLNSIQAGPLRRGTIYEVMPFDNLMVILTIKGDQLLDYLHHVAAEGGGGIAGVQMTIRDKKAMGVLVGGKPLDPGAFYTMVNSDYTVNGGGYSGLKSLPARQTGYLLRDATIDYCARFRAAGTTIKMSTDKRIKNVQ